MIEIFGENVLTDSTASSVLRKRKWECAVSFATKTVVPVEKQIKRSIFSGTCNCGQMVQKFPEIPVKVSKREYLERYYRAFSIYQEIPEIPVGM